jgi:hypothetical protein
MLNSEASSLTVDTGVVQSFEGDDRGGIHLLLWAMAMQLRMDRTDTQCRLVCQDIQNMQTLHTEQIYPHGHVGAYGTGRRSRHPLPRDERTPWSPSL